MSLPSHPGDAPDVPVETPAGSGRRALLLAIAGGVALVAIVAALHLIGVVGG